MALSRSELSASAAAAMSRLPERSRARGLSMLERAEHVFVELGAPSPLGTVLFSGCAGSTGIAHGDGVWGVAAGASLMGYACRMAGPASALPAHLADAFEAEILFTAAGDVDYDALFQDRERTKSLVDQTSEVAEDAEALTTLLGCSRDVWEAFGIAATHRLRENFVRHGIPAHALPSSETLEKLLRIGYVLRVVDEVAGERPASRTQTTPDARVVWSDGNRGSEDSDGAALDSRAWLDAAATVCAQDFEPVAEAMLQTGTLGALGLASFDDVPGRDTGVSMVARARFGYALRNSECQLVPAALRVSPDDLLSTELDGQVSPGGVGELLRDVIRYGYCGGAEALMQSMPGANSATRSAAFDARIDDAAFDDPYTGSYSRLALMHYGYLLHRVFELRPGWLRGADRPQPLRLRDPAVHAEGNGRGRG